MQLVGDIFDNVQEIVRGEIRLAAMKLLNELGKMIGGAVWLLIAGVAVFFAMAFLLGAIYLALTRVMPDWQAAMLVGSLSAVCGVGALYLGVAVRKPHLKGSLELSAACLGRGGASF